MRKFEYVKNGVVIVGLSVSLTGLFAGCTGGGTAWWGSPQLRNFETSPSAKTEGGAAKEVSPPAPGGEASVRSEPVRESQPQVAERQVNDELERLKKAYERARRAEQAQGTIQPTGRVGDSDSLAAKLSEPGTAYAGSSVYGKPAGGKTAANQPSGAEGAGAERPMITPIKREAVITGVEAKGPAEKTKSVEILNVEPAGPAEDSPKVESVPLPVLPEVKAGEGANSESEEATKPANKAIKLDIPDPASANASMDKLLQKLEQKLKERPGDTATQVKLHLVYAMLGQWQEALKGSGGKDTTGGELAKNLAALVKVFDNGELSAAEQANEALKLLNSLQDLLRQQADLAVSNMQLCREVVSFGCYKTMPAEYFVSGKRLPVIVYLELENFTSKELTKDSYQTLLSLTMEVVSGTGKVCWRKHDEKIEDLANKRRRDFYIARLVTLPAGLPSGKLQLKVTVEDLNGNKVAQRLYSFELK